MKNKLKFLTYMSLRKKIVNKWFLVANIFLFAAIVAIANIDSIIKVFGGDFNEETQIIVLDETTSSYDEFEKNFESVASYIEMFKKTELINYDKTYDDAVKVLKKEKAVLVRLITDSDNTLKATIISNKKIDEILYQSIVSSINATKVNIALSKSDIDPNELAKIYSEVEIEKKYLDEKENEEQNELLMGAIFPILVLPFFMLSLYLVQMIGAEINDEKTTRSMEIIISNVSPKTHFLSKILSGNIFVLAQSFLLLIYGGISMIVRNFITSESITNAFGDEFKTVFDTIKESGLIEKLWIIIPVTLVLIILSFIAYSLLAGILASMTTNIEDYQQLQMPLIFISLAGYYLSIAATMFSGSLFIKVASYIPLISALLSPALLILGEINLIDVSISILLLVGLNHILIKYGLRIYKIGILNYSSTKLWTRMFKAVKNKDA